MVNEMIYLHWLLCLAMFVGGVLRCEELDPKANVFIKAGTSSIPPLAILLGIGPEIFGITVSGWSAILVAVILAGVIGELSYVRRYLERA